MNEVGQIVALVLCGMTLGWTAMFSFLAAPQAFRDLDQGRANRFVRTAMRNGHPALAVFCAAAAPAAILGQAPGAAAVLALAAGMFFLARWALAPRDDELPSSARRRLKTARTVASALTIMLMVTVLAATGMVAVGV